MDNRFVSEEGILPEGREKKAYLESGNPFPGSNG